VVFSLAKFNGKKHQWYYDAITPLLLSLATVGDVTRIEIILFVSHRPRWKQVVRNHITISSMFLPTNFANANKLSA
jgi:hypothetical protein